MKRLHFVYAVITGIAVSGVLAGCEKSSDKGASSSPGGESAGQAASATNNQPVTAQFLFVQNAKDVSFDNGTMTLHGVNPVTVCFADRPQRIAGHMATSRIVPMWHEGTNSFTHDPPNATLSILSGDKSSTSDIVLVLRNPRLNGEDLTYDVQDLEGTPPSQGGACSLFIDIIGMPLTPFSYAGAARRAYRRGYAYPAYAYPGLYGPAYVPVAPVAVAPRPVVVY
jgi:hypothetical protein